MMEKTWDVQIQQLLGTFLDHTCGMHYKRYEKEPNYKNFQLAQYLGHYLSPF